MAPQVRSLVVGAAFVVATLVAGLAIDADATLSACRALNILLGSGVLVGMVVLASDRWDHLPLAEKVMSSGLIGSFAVIGGGSAEAYVQHVQVGYRSAAMTLVLLTCLTGLALARNDNRGN